MITEQNMMRRLKNLSVPPLKVRRWRFMSDDQEIVSRGPGIFGRAVHVCLAPGRGGAWQAFVDDYQETDGPLACLEVASFQIVDCPAMGEVLVATFNPEAISDNALRAMARRAQQLDLQMARPRTTSLPLLVPKRTSRKLRIFKQRA
jgi:hypothetical protein